MSQGRSESAAFYAHYGPFGSNGHYVGDYALDLLAELSKPVSSLQEVTEHKPIWSRDDAGVFDAMYQIEGASLFIIPSEEADPNDIGDLDRAFGRFHVSLPLSETERRWLFHPLDLEQERQRTWSLMRPESLIDVAEELTSGGLRQVIQGREVLRRLAAWRRETDEFAGQGTLNEAQEALGEIALTLVTEPRWPREHLDVLAQLREQDRSDAT